MDKNEEGGGGGSEEEKKKGNDDVNVGIDGNKGKDEGVNGLKGKGNENENENENGKLEKLEKKVMQYNQIYEGKWTELSGFVNRSNQSLDELGRSISVKLNQLVHAQNELTKGYVDLKDRYNLLTKMKQELEKNVMTFVEQNIELTVSGMKKKFEMGNKNGQELSNFKDRIESIETTVKILKESCDQIPTAHINVLFEKERNRLNDEAEKKMTVHIENVDKTMMRLKAEMLDKIQKNKENQDRAFEYRLSSTHQMCLDLKDDLVELKSHFDLLEQKPSNSKGGKAGNKNNKDSENAKLNESC